MLAEIRRRFMSKEAFFFPDFPAPNEGNGFAVQPDTVNPAPTSPVLLPPINIVPLYFHPIRGIDCRLLFGRVRQDAETEAFLGVRKHMHRLNTIEINRICILCRIVGWA